MLRTFGEPPIFVDVAGEWPPEVVALHGWGRTRRDFATALAGLSFAALDLPGFGASPPPPSPWGSRDYAERVLEFLEGSVARPVVLVGHSFGGRIAVRCAAARPDLVRALVLTGAPVARVAGTGRRPSMRYRLIRRARRLGLISEEAVERARKRHGSPDYADASPIMRGVLGRVLPEDYSDDLRSIRQPVMLLWGSEDVEVPPEVARLASEMLANSRMTVVPGAGHDIPWTNAPALRNAVEEALVA